MEDTGLLYAIVASGVAFTLFRQAIGRNDYLVDLRQFYCGGWSLLHHNNPYVSNASATCINAIDPGGAVMGVPHPPFAVAAYALFALVPYHIFSVAYIICAWLAIGGTAHVLSRITPLKAWVIAIALTPLLGYVSTSLGQPQPFIALCIASCAFFLHEKRYVAAAVCAALTALLPQFGLPLIATLFVCVPKARVPLVATLAGLGAIGLLALGPAANIDYVRVALPHEQWAVGHDSLQYSLPWFLQQFGVNSNAATSTGTLWYCVVFGAGVVFVRRIVTNGTIVLAALVPSALVPLSCSYVDIQQFALALPFVVVALGTSRRLRMPVLLGAALLVVPWNLGVVSEPVGHNLVRIVILCALGVAFVAAYVRARRSEAWPFPPLTAGAVLALYVLIEIAIAASIGQQKSVETPPNTFATLSFKLPTLIGLAIALVYGVRGIVNERGSEDANELCAEAITR